MQTKTQSLVETIFNVGSGIFIAILVQIVVFPLYGLETTLSQNIQISCIFTIVSIVRSYIWRRVFNYVHRV